MSSLRVRTSDVDDIRAFVARRDPDGRLPKCRIRRVVVGDVLESVGDLALSLAPHGRRCILLVDAVEIRRNGDSVKDTVEAVLRRRFAVERYVLDDGTATLHADDHILDEATEAVRGAALVVTVGGGTVTDIGKWGCSQIDPPPPLLVVQTAASVDGFTDDVSVLLRSGVKRTVPTRWPDIVVADLGVIADAPAVMNQAGYGEMLSMFTAPADWFVASQLGLDLSFHEAPIALLGTAGQGIDQWSRGVARGETDAVGRLVQALVVRGITTGIAGSTAVLSGMEHLVSHMLDLHHAQRGEPTGLHGAQVGVASLVAAAAHELLVERLDRAGKDIFVPRVDRQAWQARVTAAYAALDPSGTVTAECWADVYRKLDTWTERQDAVTAALAEWPRWRDRVVGMVRPVDALASGLAAAQGALQFGDLDPPIPPELARWAVENCGLMRNRFTVVDVLALLGWWEQDDVTRVLDRSSAAAAAAAAVAAATLPTGATTGGKDGRA